ncbi:MAG: exodeoxyribonuclease VII large subunit [Candidatus Eremiobacteraeota bacterium]|nr:exodeoxyribonuclease VII large subunit [Candidatus Eremiobacteraeota bacterium]
MLNLPLLLSAAPLTVSQFARAVEGALQASFPSPVRVHGEVSGAHFAAASGHTYFDLKDQYSVVRCVCWATSEAASYIADVARDGAALEVVADVRSYAKRSEYQLSVLEAVPVGRGRLFRLFEALKAKLAVEGLFDDARKRAIPPFVREVAIVTSRDGMALHDFVTAARARGAHVRITLVNAPVQGEAAAPGLAAAIRRAGRLGVDAVVIARGGGSLEDLWAFNTEIVARAIVASARPVISAVGHEGDVTIADLVADRRVATPTAAAVLVAGEWAKLVERFAELSQRLARTMRLFIASAVQQLDDLSSGLKRNDPRIRLEDLRRRTREAERALRQSFARSQEERRGRLAGAVAGLTALGPLQTLARGYAIVFDGSGQVLTDARRARLGQEIDVLLRSGSLRADVVAHSSERAAKEVRDGRVALEEEAQD